MSEEKITKSKHIRTLSLASSKPESKVHSVSMSNAFFWTFIIAMCVLAGVLLGVLFFESKQVVDITGEIRTREREYETLQTRYDELSLEKAALEEQIQVLSDTINQRVMEDEAMATQEANERIPRAFPVTGSVTETDPPEEDNALEMAVYYEADVTAVVVSTARGEVLSVRENAYGNYEIQIDHGNSYVSIYTNAGYPLLEEGVQVTKGTPLFYVGEENTLVKYQISSDGALINVYEVMKIDG